MRRPRHHARESVSFAEAFEAEFPAIYRYLRRRLGATIAEELAAQTFATAYANWSRFDQSRPVRPWLYGIASNLLRHRRRTEERQLRAYARTGVDPASGADETASVEKLDAQACRPQLAAALAALRPAEREVLLLHAWADLNDGEIAVALSLPLGTVKSRLHRARKHLRNSLGLDGQEASGMVATRRDS